MRAVNLYIYPIKSGPAVAVQHAEALERGLAHDRRFMVVDPSGTFLTQRSHPALGRCAVTIGEASLTLQADGLEACEVPLEPTGGEAVQARVWSDTVSAVFVSEAADAFFSALLETPARLVFMPEQSRRPVDGFDDVAVSFADGYPVLVANTASLEDLNRRIEGPALPMLAFRPNIVIETETPWAEDDWEALALGDAVLTCTTGCERCSVTTLDPARPDKPRPDQEPLRTLATFRRNEAGKVIFGRNAIVRKTGTIRVD